MTLHSYLSPGETVVQVTRRHASVLLRPFIVAVVAVALALLAGLVLSPDSGIDLLDIVAVALVVPFLLRLSWSFVAWRRHAVVITELQVLELIGVLRRRAESFPIRRITQVGLETSLPGRLLRYGDLVLRFGSEEFRLEKLSRAQDIYRMVAELLHQEDTGPLPRVVV